MKSTFLMIGSSLTRTRSQVLPRQIVNITSSVSYLQTFKRGINSSEGPLSWFSDRQEVSVNLVSRISQYWCDRKQVSFSYLGMKTINRSPRIFWSFCAGKFDTSTKSEHPSMSTDLPHTKELYLLEYDEHEKHKKAFEFNMCPQWLSEMNGFVWHTLSDELSIVGEQKNSMTPEYFDPDAVLHYPFRSGCFFNLTYMNIIDHFPHATLHNYKESHPDRVNFTQPTS